MMKRKDCTIHFLNYGLTQFRSCEAAEERDLVRRVREFVWLIAHGSMAHLVACLADTNSSTVDLTHT